MKILYTCIMAVLTLISGCVIFIISDSYGDGIFCIFGNGGYTVIVDDDVDMAEGGEFGDEETKTFCPVPEIDSNSIPTF